MDVYVPILGLEKYGLEAIQPLEIRNLNAPGASTMPPATNVNNSLSNLLLHIDTLYAIQKKKEITHRKELHAVFRLPNLTNPEIFQGQYMLQSLGLGLMTKAYDFTKTSRYHIRFDFICATGVIKKFPTEDNIVNGDFLDHSTGDLERKLELFITYIKEHALHNKRGAFVYSGKSAKEKLEDKLKQAGLNNVEVIKADNFIELMETLFLNQKARSMFLIIPFFLILVTGIFFLMNQVLPNDPCVSLLEAVKTKNTDQLDELLKQCNNLEIKDSTGKTPLMYAIEKKDSEAAVLLIDGGAQVNVAAYKNNKNYLEFLQKACHRGISALPCLKGLELRAELWGVYWEDRLPHFYKTQHVLQPAETTSQDVLVLSFLGGEAYSFAHFYINIKPADTAQSFKITAMLKLLQETTYNNRNGDSRVQAVEVSFSKFYKTRRYELALQWQNVGDGAPQWRYWDPEKGWVGFGLYYELQPQIWHTLSLAGTIADNRVYYTDFMIDNKKYTINKSAISSAVPDSEDFLAVAVQLNSNYQADPYTVSVKNINVETMD